MQRSCRYSLCKLFLMLKGHSFVCNAKTQSILCWGQAQFKNVCVHAVKNLMNYGTLILMWKLLGQKNFPYITCLPLLSPSASCYFLSVLLFHVSYILPDLLHMKRIHALCRYSSMRCHYLLLQSREIVSYWNHDIF